MENAAAKKEESYDHPLNKMSYAPSQHSSQTPKPRRRRGGGGGRAVIRCHRVDGGGLGSTNSPRHPGHIWGHPSQRILHRGQVLGNDEEPVQHDPSPLDQSQENPAEEGRPRGRAEALAHLEEAARGGAGDDGVPGVLLLAGVDHGAVKGGEKASPDGEAPADPRRVHAHGLGAADEALPVGGVVEALEEVESGAADGAHAKGAADVVEDAIGAWFAGGLRRSHSCPGDATLTTAICVRVGALEGRREGRKLGAEGGGEFVAAPTAVEGTRLPG
ncbi:hypothetical protein Taro_032012 [Colocasia esculenta]|uniref:Uncharacterized protein n=1 Tax=Colocasia esculenta TaxID=4460 RepID=A0A843VK97_COLES|nr:hypothetical protein [Colocasia esculenta]